MAATKEFILYTPEEYLDAEAASEVKHEYLGGTVHAMAGASKRHIRLVRRIDDLLNARLQGGPCEAWSPPKYPSIFLLSKRMGYSMSGPREWGGPREHSRRGWQVRRFRLDMWVCESKKMLHDPGSVVVAELSTVLRFR